MKQPPARAAGPVIESKLVQVHVPGPLARRLALVAPGVRLDALCVAALGELVERLEEQGQERGRVKPTLPARRP